MNNSKIIKATLFTFSYFSEEVKAIVSETISRQILARMGFLCMVEIVNVHAYCIHKEDFNSLHYLQMAMGISDILVGIDEDTSNIKSSQKDLIEAIRIEKVKRLNFLKIETLEILSLKKEKVDKKSDSLIEILKQIEKGLREEEVLLKEVTVLI